MEAKVEGQIVTYQPSFAKAFAELNYEWIEHYFSVEEEDKKALDHPETYVRGGEIFFVLVDDEPVGTVAMVPFAEENGQVTIFELAKMAVRPDQQGNGFSRLLMQACVEYANNCGAQEIMLVTNDVLAPALALYEAYGFKALAKINDVRYERGNLEMRLQL
jgi:GNAT superfamily N-acetyltransferase